MCDASRSSAPKPPADASGSPASPQTARPSSGQLPLQSLPRVIPVEQLLGDEDEVCILCGSQLYRLRRTRQGKLILYK